MRSLSQWNGVGRLDGWTDPRLICMDPALESSLDGVLDTLRASSRGGRISASKIMAVAKVCVGEGKHDYKHVVQKIERFTRKMKVDQALVGLYAIDSICKRSQKVFGGSGKDIYSKRFAQNIESVLAALASRISTKDLATAHLVVEAWRELGLMESALLDRCAAVTQGGDITPSSAGGASGPPSAATASLQTAPAALAANTTAGHVAAEAVAALFSSSSGGASAVQRRPPPQQQQHAYAPMHRTGRQQRPPPLQQRPQQHPQRVRPQSRPQQPERARRREQAPPRAPLQPPPPRRIGHSAQSPPYSHAVSPQSWVAASPPSGSGGGVVHGSPPSYYAASPPPAQLRVPPLEYRAAPGSRPSAPPPSHVASRRSARTDNNPRGGAALPQPSQREPQRHYQLGAALPQRSHEYSRGGGELKRGRASRWGTTAPRAPPMGHSSVKRPRDERWAPPRREGAGAGRDDRGARRAPMAMPRERGRAPRAGP